MDYRLSASNWVVRLADGDERAVETMFAKYFDRLIRLASRKMTGLNQAPRSDEDVAISAVRSFCSAVRGQKLVVASEDDVWACLFKITTRKVCAERRRAYAKKREGRGRVQIDNDPDEPDFFEQVVGREPSPELALETAELADSLLELFDKNSIQRQIIEMKLQGRSNREISAEVNLVERTVYWHLQQILLTWTFLKNGEYLFENAFDDVGLDELARSLELPLEKIFLFFEQAIKLWSVDVDDPSLVELLQIKLFHPQEYLQRRFDDKESVERLENSLGKICNQWKTRLRSGWKAELQKTLK